MHAKRISNEELLASLSAALKEEGQIIARVVAMLIDVEDRSLHLADACPSMFDFCTRKLGMSEGEAYRRITAARLAKRFPQVLTALQARRIHLSSLMLLRDVLTKENVVQLLERAAGKTKRAVQQLVAILAPKPDVPATIRRLPHARPAPEQPVPAQPVAAAAVVAPLALAPEQPVPAQPVSAAAVVAPLASAPEQPVPAQPVSAAAVVAPLASAPRVPAPGMHAPRAQIVPLAETRHKVQFTASSELRDMLERAQSLMRHASFEGDLAVVIERAMRLLIADLEKKKLAATKRPARSRAGAATTKTIPAATRREVIRRDAEQCAFVSPSGERCPSRDYLELDHEHPRALGGTNDPANLRLLCRAHNQYAAERIFGRTHMKTAIHVRRNKRRSASTSTPSATQTPHPLT